MALKISFLQLLVIICPYLLTVSSLNFNYPAVFNFGDSNSDTGALIAGVAFPLESPHGQTYFHEPSGRFCDGRLIIDFLMNVMDQQFLNPYLDSVGAPDFRTGCNFAAGGATILPANSASTCPFSFNIQVAQFVRFKARVLELLAGGISNILAKPRFQYKDSVLETIMFMKRLTCDMGLVLDKKLQKYLPPEDYFKKGLYMFDMGQNDLDGAFHSKSEDQVLALIPAILSQFETGFQNLYNEGARNFWIHNTGPLGCLPRIIAAFGKDSSKLDQLGCVKSHNNAANLFNAQLHDFCTKFQAQFPEANVTYVDIFSIKLDIISKFSQYGFKEPLAACCGYGGPPLNFDNRIGCGQTKNLNGSTVTANPCNNTAEYVNWDGNHYTEAANRHISEQILTGNYSYPPISVKVPLLVSQN